MEDLVLACLALVVGETVRRSFVSRDVAELELVDGDESGQLDSASADFKGYNIRFRFFRSPFVLGAADSLYSHESNDCDFRISMMKKRRLFHVHVTTLRQE